MAYGLWLMADGKRDERDERDERDRRVAAVGRAYGLWPMAYENRVKAWKILCANIFLLRNIAKIKILHYIMVNNYHLVCR